MDKKINITLNQKGEINLQADGPSEIEAYGMLVTALFIIKNHNKGEIRESRKNRPPKTNPSPNPRRRP